MSLSKPMFVLRGVDGLGPGTLSSPSALDVLLLPQGDSHPALPPGSWAGCAPCDLRPAQWALETQQSSFKDSEEPGEASPLLDTHTTLVVLTVDRNHAMTP